MHFGDFLIEQKVVTRSQILDALVYQVENTPSLLRLCLERKVLSEDEAYQIVKAQIKEQKSLITIFFEKNLLKQSQIDFLQKEQLERRPKLSEILIRRSILDADQLAVLLKQYLMNKESDFIKNDSDKNKSELKNLNPEVSLLNPEEIIPHFDFIPLEQEMIDEYIDFFDSSKRQDIETIVLSWTKGVDIDLLRQLYRDLHTLKGTARFLKAFLSEFVIHNLENIISESIRAIDFLGSKSHNVSELESIILKGLDILWVLRDVIIESKTEKNYWDNGLNRQKVIHYLWQVKKMQNDLFDLQENINLDDFKNKF